MVRVTEEEHWHSLRRRAKRLLEGVVFEQELEGGLAEQRKAGRLGRRGRPGTSVS